VRKRKWRKGFEGKKWRKRGGKRGGENVGRKYREVDGLVSKTFFLFFGVLGSVNAVWLWLEIKITTTEEL
jgi:hypothetical protein